MTRTKQQRPRHILDPNDRGISRNSTVTSGEEQSSSDDFIEVDDSMREHVENADMPLFLPSPPPLRRDDLTPVSNISCCGNESSQFPAKSFPNPRSPQGINVQESLLHERTNDQNNTQQPEHSEILHGRFNLMSDRGQQEMPMPNSYTHIDYLRYMKDVISNTRKDRREASTNRLGNIRNGEIDRYTTPPYGENTAKDVANIKNGTNGFASSVQQGPLWQHMFHPLQLMAKLILESQKNSHSTVENHDVGLNVPNVKLTHSDDSINNMRTKMLDENGTSRENDDRNIKTELKWNDVGNVYADSTTDVGVSSGESETNPVAFRPYLPVRKNSDENHEHAKACIDIVHMSHKQKASKGNSFPVMNVTGNIYEQSRINLEQSTKVVSGDDWKQTLSTKTIGLPSHKHDEAVESYRRQEKNVLNSESEPKESNTQAARSKVIFSHNREGRFTSSDTASDTQLSVSSAPLFHRRSHVESPYRRYSNYSSSTLPTSSQSKMSSYIYSPSRISHGPHLPLQLPFTQLSEFPPIPSPAYYNPWAMVCPPFHSAIDPIAPNPFLRRRFQHDLQLPLRNRYALNNRNELSNRPQTPSASIKCDANVKKRPPISRNKMHSNSALDSLHAAIVREAKEMNKGMDPENMYIECPICHKKIKRLYHFQRHMRIHSGEKSHTCPFCPYKSVRKDNLKSHMKTHEKGKYDASKRPQMRRENNARHLFSYSRDFPIADNKGILHSDRSQGLCEPVSPISTNNSLHLTPFSDNSQSLSESMSPASNGNQNEVPVSRHATIGEGGLVSLKPFSTGLKNSADDYAPLITPFSTHEKDFDSISRDKKPRSSFFQTAESRSPDHPSVGLFDDDQEAIELRYKVSDDENRNLRIRPLKYEYGTNDNHALKIRKRPNSNQELSQGKTKSQKLDISTWYKTDMEKILLLNTNNCNNKDTKPFRYFSPSDTFGPVETVPRTKFEYEKVSKNRNNSDIDEDKFFTDRNKIDQAKEVYQNGETGNRFLNLTFSTGNANSSSEGKFESECLKKILHSNITDCAKDVESDQGRRVDSNRDTPTSERRSSDEEGVRTKTTSVNEFLHPTEEKFHSPTPNTPQLAHSLGSIFKDQQRVMSSDDTTHKRRVNSCWLGTSRESKCRLCDFVATSTSSLQEHMATHREDGLYKCQQCDYHGKNLSKLIEHIRIHTGERPFRCDQCSYAAKRKDNLAQHKSVRHDKNRFKGSSKATKNSSQSETRVSPIGPRDKISKYRDTEYKSMFLPIADQLSSRALIGNEKTRDNWLAKYDYPASDELRSVDSNNTNIESSSVAATNNSLNPLNSYVFPASSFLTCDNMMSSFMYRHPLMTASMFHTMPSLPTGENPLLNNTALNYASRFTNSPQFKESMRRKSHLNQGGTKFSTTLEECAR